MGATVETLCKALVDCRLLSPDAIRGLYQRWLREAKEGAPDVGRFSRWLVDNRIASEYQLGVLARGRGDQLFLNQYKLVDRVGKGRMAGVYKAVHNLGQAVAIKVLPPSKARDPAVFARFQREARLAVRLEHPNVVRTFQTDDMNGLHYLVMEYLEGETLAEVLQRRGALPVAEALRIAYQALLGLQHLHEKGLVHRDVTPGNLMVVGAEGDDTLKATVKILDIGTGRELFDEESGGEKEYALTNEGDILGTPLYMAPEQAGDPHGADIRSDLYSLGCVLYHALAGRPPFEDKSNVRLLVRHATEAPRPLSEVCRDAPAGLQRVMDRLLAKDRTKRFATPDEASKALAQFLTEAVPSEFGPKRPEFQAYLRWLAQQAGGQTDGQAGGSEADEPAPPPPSEPMHAPVPLDLMAQLARSAPGMAAPRGLKEAAEARRRGKPEAPAPERQSPPAPSPQPSPQPSPRPSPRDPSRQAPAAVPAKGKVPGRPPPPRRKPADEEILDVERVSETLDIPRVEVASDVSVEPLTELPNGPTRGGLTGRDLAMLGIGVGVVFILLLAVLIVVLLVR